jgi:hypothetical protein
MEWNALDVEENLMISDSALTMILCHVVLDLQEDSLLKKLSLKLIFYLKEF